MIIDCHSHLYPPELAEDLERWGIPIPFDRDAVARLLHQQDEAGVAASVISNPFLLQRVERIDPGRVFGAVRRYHDYVAELAARHAPRLVPLALVDPFSGQRMFDELERAVLDCGCRGVLVNPHYGGRFLDTAEAEPFWEAVEALAIPVFYHPADSVTTQPYLEKWRLVESVGRPLDTTLGLGRLIMSGFFERRPQIELLAAHMGGGILMLPGRLDYVFRLREDPRFGPWGEGGIQDLPSGSLGRLHVDTMGFHPPAVRLAVEVLGSERVLFGSDHPPVALPLAESVDAVRGARLPPEAESAVLGGNARRMFRLT